MNTETAAEIAKTKNVRPNIEKLREDVTTGKYDAFINKVQKQIQEEKLAKINFEKEQVQLRAKYLNIDAEKSLLENKIKELELTYKKSIAEISNQYLQEKNLRELREKEMTTLKQEKLAFAERITFLEKQVRDSEYQKKYLEEKSLRETKEKELANLKKSEETISSLLEIYRERQYNLDVLERKNAALTKSLNDAKQVNPKIPKMDLESARKLGYAEGLFYAIDEYGSERTFDRKGAENELKHTLNKLQDEQQLYKSIGEDFSTLHKNLVYKINMKIFNAASGGNVGNTLRSSSNTKFSSTTNAVIAETVVRSKSYKINEYRNMQRFLSNFPSYHISNSDTDVAKLILIQGRVELDANNIRENDEELRTLQKKLLESVKFELRHVTDAQFRKCAALDIDTEQFGKLVTPGYLYSDFGLYS